MKALLASLLCYVLFASQCFAIKGGPNYGGSASLVGQYAGVLTSDYAPGSMSSNSLGIFTLTVPSIGFASGSMIIFTQGVYFFGAIQGVGEPSGTISALANAVQTRTDTVADSDGNLLTVTRVVSVLDGSIQASIKSGSQSSSVALRGTATFSQHAPDETAGGPEVFFVVSGFKQSNFASG